MIEKKIFFFTVQLLRSKNDCSGGKAPENINLGNNCRPSIYICNHSTLFWPLTYTVAACGRYLKSIKATSDCGRPRKFQGIPWWLRSNHLFVILSWCDSLFQEKGESNENTWGVSVFDFSMKILEVYQFLRLVIASSKHRMKILEVYQFLISNENTWGVSVFEIRDSKFFYEINFTTLKTLHINHVFHNE